ncbi:hypothetical protein AV521_17545 [Streptomyces sp. IMTB 2501]|uniref:Uma2 family endonuclease n=1 Tax=Streptomyces sp. IMTB 2501 TaxID=1776340 RepID=UPI00096F42E3|nr:Uma2 family endonuclease [Streptomyces sp. IMTB 2501]OLZ69341.1 hypothetical protein AV521_17545 [Streptomyces sp. IMTB 2501]
MTVAEGWVELVQGRIEVPRSARLRLTRNGLTSVPVTHAHTTTARRIANQIEERLPGVVEVVSPENKNRDYKTKPEHYALRGIPAYLIVDVRTATWTLLTQPENGAYQFMRI